MHNQKTEQELHEEQKFLQGYGDIKRLNSDMASTKGDIGAVYKRLKDLGWTKKDVEFALSLEDKDVGQVIADFERKIRIAKIMGHRLGRQVELFAQDKTPQTEVAYDEGFAAGRARKQNSNPYQPGAPEFNRWQEGFNEGNALANKNLAAEVNGD